MASGRLGGHWPSTAADGIAIHRCSLPDTRTDDVFERASSRWSPIGSVVMPQCLHRSVRCCSARVGESVPDRADSAATAGDQGEHRRGRWRIRTRSLLAAGTTALVCAILLARAGQRVTRARGLTQLGAAWRLSGSFTLAFKSALAQTLYAMPRSLIRELGLGLRTGWSSCTEPLPLLDPCLLSAPLSVDQRLSRWTGAAGR